MNLGSPLEMRGGGKQRNKLLALAFQMRRGVPVIDRSVRKGLLLHKYEHCLVGVEAVNWLLNNQLAQDRHGAAEICDSLIEVGLMKKASTRTGAFIASLLPSAMANGKGTTNLPNGFLDRDDAFFVLSKVVSPTKPKKKSSRLTSIR